MPLEAVRGGGSRTAETCGLSHRAPCLPAARVSASWWAGVWRTGSRVQRRSVGMVPDSVCGDQAAVFIAVSPAAQPSEQTLSLALLVPSHWTQLFCRETCVCTEAA